MESKMRFGLLGSNIGYSLSPKLHQAVFAKEKIDATYEVIDIEKHELDQTFVNTLASKFKGFNVTIPFKESIIPYLDSVDEKARHIGAVNTVVVENGKLKGYNTDYQGFVYTLEMLGVSKLKRAIVLGTGGASKMAVCALEALGASEVLVVSRWPKETGRTQTISYERLEETDLPSDLLINATPLGSIAHVEEMLVSERIIGRQKYVVDLVYKPAQTKLLKAAKFLNVPCVNGLPMLVVQALEAESIWFGRQMNTEELREVMKLHIK